MRQPTVGTSSKTSLTVRTISPTASIADALSQMNEHQVHHLVVMDESKAVGVLSDRDILWRSLDAGSTTLKQELTARDVMHKVSTEIADDTLLADAIFVMRATGTSALPVFRNNMLVGILTESDLVKYLGNSLSLMAKPTPGKPETSSLFDRGTMALGNPVVQEVLNLLSEAGI